MDKLRQAAWTAIHKINLSTGFDEESDNLLMEAASVLREALDHSGEANKMVAEQAEQVSLPKLTDEVIADLWHQSGCHLHKFAKMLRDWLQENAE